MIVRNKKREVRRMLDKEDIQVLNKVLELYFADKKINLSGKVDIYQLADRLDFDVRKASFKDEKIEGILLVNENVSKIDGFLKPRCIALSSNNDKMTNRFIVAHELSHYIFEKVIQENESDPLVLSEARMAHTVGTERDIYEQAIDYMAASILIPLNDFIQKYNNARSEKMPTQEFIEQMSEYYGVTKVAIMKRIDEVAIMEA